MPWIAASYPRRHFNGIEGLLAAIVALLGHNLRSWSIAARPSGTADVIMQVAELPESFNLGEVIPEWAVCTEECALQEARAHGDALCNMPDINRVRAATPSRVLISRQRKSAKDAPKPVSFVEPYDDRSTCIAPGLYLTGSPCTTAGYRSIAVQACYPFKPPWRYDISECIRRDLGYKANFRVGDLDLGGTIWLLMMRKNPKEVYVYGKGEEHSQELSVDMYLTAVGDSFPPGTFDTWTDGERQHSFEVAGRGYTVQDRQMLWKAWLSNPCAITPWERNEIVPDGTYGYMAKIDVELAADGSYKLLAKFDFSRVHIEQLIPLASTAAAHGRDSIRVKLAKPPVYTDYRYSANSTDIADGPAGSLRGVVNCIHDTIRRAHCKIPWT